MVWLWCHTTDGKIYENPLTGVCAALAQRLADPRSKIRAKPGRLLVVFAIGGAVALAELSYELLMARRRWSGRLGRLHENLLGFLPLALRAHFIVRRGCRPWLALILPVTLRIHDAEIVLGMLVEVFRRHPVAACLGLARHRQIALEHLVGIAADLNARAVALEVLRAMRRARPVEMRTAAASMRAAATSVRTAAAASVTTA